MSCYVRHLDEVLSAAGIVRTLANSVKLDQIFHEIMGEKEESLKTAECNLIWSKLQVQVSDPKTRKQLIEKVRERYSDKV